MFVDLAKLAQRRYSVYGGTASCPTYGAYLAQSVPETSSGGQNGPLTGRRFDAETGLYYYRARYYAPDDRRGGRFLQTDPVGYTADLNLYAYGGG
jgi:RHS repeat-associated protein